MSNTRRLRGREMTEDPRDYGLTAADLRAAADRLYAPDDPRLDRIRWAHATQVRYGDIRSRLRGLADAIGGVGAEPEALEQPALWEGGES
jgi:hypothetical protein